MNRRAVALLNDLINAGVTQEPVFIVPAPLPGRYARFGVIARTDETEKMEIAGLPCGVKSETETEVRVFVEIGGKVTGPYRLKPQEVLRHG